MKSTIMASDSIQIGKKGNPKVVISFVTSKVTQGYEALNVIASKTENEVVFLSASRLR